MKAAIYIVMIILMFVSFLISGLFLANSEMFDESGELDRERTYEILQELDRIPFVNFEVDKETFMNEFDSKGEVCGKIEVQCIKAPCDPVEETFSNRSEAEERGAYDIRDGECINDFESCILAGNPAMESYPRKCRDPESGKTFTEIIDDEWKLDDIQLMRHESEFYYGCFGCSVPKDGSPGLCVDPVPEMKFFSETKSLHCNENFEVVMNEGAIEEIKNGKRK